MNEAVLRSGRLRARPPRLTPAGLLTVGVLLLCAIGGGSARVDPVSLQYLRPCVALLVAALMFVPVRDEGATRGATISLLLWAAAITIQLVPLPPALWTALPGHARFAALAALTGAPAPWRPVSLVPMSTWNALAALLPAWAGLAAMARLSRREVDRLPAALLVVAAASVLLGALQIAAGRGYLYAVTSPGLPVGLFANRNHQAAFLAASVPMLAAWAHPRGAEPWHRAKPWLALAAALLVIILLMVTGSRAGLALGAIGVVAATWLAPPLPVPHQWRRRWGRSSRLLRLAPAILAILAVLLAITLGRSLATARLLALTGTPAEQRTQALPTLLTMTREFLPFGSGFGTFDPVFRILEPDALLHRSVFNHAHDDLVEVALTGGLPALAVLAGFLIWLARRASALRPDRNRVAVAAAISLAILLGASLVDYPLRTPLLAMIAALLAGAVARGGEARLVAAEPRG